MQNSSLPGTRRGLLLTLLVLGVVTALILVPSQFRSEAVSKGEGLFTRTRSADPGLKNFDIRTEKSNEIGDYLDAARQSSGKDAVAVADVRDGFVRGEDALRSRIPNVKFEYNTDLRIPEVITPDVWKKSIDWLSSPSTTKRADILRNFVRENNELVGMTSSQIDRLKVTADYTNPAGNMSFANLEQRINDVPVFRGEIKAGFTTDGRIVRVINNLAPGLDYESLSTDFRNPVDALRAAARHINVQLPESDLAVNESKSTNSKTVFGSGGDWSPTAERMYFPTEPGIAVTAWRVLIWEPVNAYYVIVDATNGTMLWRKNVTEDQAQSATYQVYNNANAFVLAADNPAPLSPGPLVPTSNTQGALATRSNVTLIGNEAPNAFNNNGWVTDGANITDGNALEAGIDRDGTNGVDAPQTGAPNRVFDSTWNPPPGNPAPGDEPLTAQAQRGAVIQMFYVMNRYHDVLYRLGFTEQAQNFQASNFGRGGVENDRVSAEGQDSSGTNNANFATVADGGRGRMQMFLWTGPTPDYDGTGDAEVIIHEVTHGTSNRLHGNASGLSTNMSRGMGEGWGDFYGYSLLSEPADPINGVYTTGGYATFLLGGMQSNYYYGIRRFPRAPITFLGPNGKPHNPFTFKYVNADCDTNIGTTATNPNSAYPRNPVVSTSSGTQACDQVHNLGEVWSSTLWEVRNRMVTRLGFTAGTTRALQVVTDGMKLAPIGPTFLQERDAIIAAAAALPIAPEASADVLDVREGFRVRGMGFSASIQNAGTGANNTAVTEAFDVPNAIITNPITISDATGDNDGFPEPGEAITVSVPITNNSGGGTINNVVGMVTGGGSANYGNIADGATVTRSIAYTIPAGAVCGSDHTITITGTSDLGALNPKTFTFRLGQPVGGAPVTFTSSVAVRVPGTGTGPGVADVYPTTLNVSGLSGNKTIKLELTNLSTTYPGDMDWLLVGPGGQKFIILSDAISSFTTQTNAVVVLKDSAAAGFPATGTTNMNGDWKPTDHTAGDTFAAPAPAGPYMSPAPVGAATFATVYGSDSSTMNGMWSLYGVDDVSGDFATITGWKLTFEANDYVCTLGVRSRADFDGDGKTDTSVFRNGTWFLNESTAGFVALGWGVGSDTLVPGDYDGDGKTDTAVFRPTADPAQPDFYILNSNGFTVTGASWGIAGDIPVVADYNSDTKSDIAVYRPSNTTWYVLNSGGGATFTVFGQAGDVPVAGNFGGNSNADLTLYRSSTNSWVTQISGGGVLNFVHGTAGDILVPADYDGDNIDDRAVFRPSTGQWFILRSTDGAVVISAWGISTDIPVPGDYDGDGKDDVAVYRNGQWWLNRSTSGPTTVIFGIAGDTPIPRRYLP
jgi:hypothetical protein